MLFSASTRLTQVQRSLLLLSRITNREFSNNSDINLCELIRQSMETFSEALNIRKIRVEEKIEECWLEVGRRSHRDAYIIHMLSVNKMTCCYPQ